MSAHSIAGWIQGIAVVLTGVVLGSFFGGVVGAIIGGLVSPPFALPYGRAVKQGELYGGEPWASGASCSTPRGARSTRGPAPSTTASTASPATPSTLDEDQGHGLDLAEEGRLASTPRPSARSRPGATSASTSTRRSTSSRRGCSGRCYLPLVGLNYVSPRSSRTGCCSGTRAATRSPASASYFEHGVYPHVWNELWAYRDAAKPAPAPAPPTASVPAWTCDHGDAVRGRRSAPGLARRVAGDVRSSPVLPPERARRRRDGDDGEPAIAAYLLGHRAGHPGRGEASPPGHRWSCAALPRLRARRRPSGPHSSCSTVCSARPRRRCRLDDDRRSTSTRSRSRPGGRSAPAPGRAHVPGRRPSHARRCRGGPARARAAAARRARPCGRCRAACSAPATCPSPGPRSVVAGTGATTRTSTRRASSRSRPSPSAPGPSASRSGRRAALHRRRRAQPATNPSSSAATSWRPDHALLRSPGVYVEEVPGGARPIGAVGTSTAAFVGAAPDRRARPGEAVAVNSWSRVRAVSSPTDATEATAARHGASTASSTTAAAAATSSTPRTARRSPARAASAPACGRSRRSTRSRSWPRPATPTSTRGRRCSPTARSSRTGSRSSTRSADGRRRRAADRGRHGGARPAPATAPAAAAAAAGDGGRGRRRGRRATAGAGARSRRPPPATRRRAAGPASRRTAPSTSRTAWSRDPLSGEQVTAPPSGHMAGIWARTDLTRGVHKAPANETGPRRPRPDLRR